MNAYFECTDSVLMDYKCYYWHDLCSIDSEVDSLDYKLT